MNKDEEILRLKEEIKDLLVFAEPPTDLEWEIIRKRLSFLLESEAKNE